MTQYVLAYHGGKQPESPEKGAESYAKWQNWLGELGEAVINPGTPLSNSKMVSLEGVNDDLGPEAMMGFSVITAENMEAALEITKSCPFLEMGNIVLSEVKEMSAK